jgi:hypothetical protein
MDVMSDMKTPSSSESAPSTLITDAELDKRAPPSFGHAMHELFEFDPSYTNLNHGEFHDRVLLHTVPRLMADAPKVHMVHYPSQLELHAKNFPLTSKPTQTDSCA